MCDNFVIALDGHIYFVMFGGVVVIALVAVLIYLCIRGGHCSGSGNVKGKYDKKRGHVVKYNANIDINGGKSTDEKRRRQGRQTEEI